MIISTRELISFFLGWLVDKILGYIPLPQKIGHQIESGSRHILKWIFLNDIKINYVFKSNQFENYEFDLDLVKNLDSVKKLSYEGLKGQWEVYSTTIGNIKPTITFKPVYLPKNGDLHNDLYISSIEVDIQVENIKYKRFDVDIIDIINLKNDIQNDFISNCLGNFGSDSITCELRELYRFSGILSEFNMHQLEGELNENIVTFSTNQLTIFGRIDSDLLQLIKKIISFYY